MKKRVTAVSIALLLAICLLAALIPTVTNAAIATYFVAVNDTLLPFNEDTMPFISGGNFFLPDNVFERVDDIWAIGSDSLEHIRLYKGRTYVDFFTDSRQTVDHEGNTLRWPPARRIDSKFYMPLRQVCDYFGLESQIIRVSDDIIPDQQMYVVRIISTSRINGETFVGLNRNAIRTSYNQYYAPPQPPSPPPTDFPPPPTVEPPPSFPDVTVYLSFYDISAGSADGILDLFDLQAESGFHSCFFVNGNDIARDPGFIRRVYGTGHMIGIWLETGTYSEYAETSALLFEAAKVKTVIISAEEASVSVVAMAEANNLIFWASDRSLEDYDAQSVPLITETIPIESGASMNLMFSCSENAASVLPGVYSFLLVNEYTVSRITETVEPVAIAESLE